MTSMIDWLWNNKEWIFSGIGIAVVTWLWALLSRKSAGPNQAFQSNAVTQSPAVSQAPFVHQQPNIKNEIHLTVHDPIPGPTQGPEPKSLEQRPRHNVQILNRRVAWISEEIGQYFIEAIEQGGKHFKAFVVDCRNEPVPNKNIPTWYEVSAAITYLDEHGMEIQHTRGASWVEAGSPRLNFPLQQKRVLIVAICLPNEWITLEGNEARALPEQKLLAKIVLYDKHGLSLPAKILEMDLGLGTLGYFVDQ